LYSIYRGVRKNRGRRRKKEEEGGEGREGGGEIRRRRKRRRRRNKEEKDTKTRLPLNPLPPASLGGSDALTAYPG
jgi:hypothetical protein